MRLLLFTIFIGLFVHTFGQNPFANVGQQHNLLLAQLFENENTIELYLRPIANYSFNNYATYGDAEILSFLDQSNIPEFEKKTIIDFLSLSDDLPIIQIEGILDSLENDAIKKQASPISLGFLSVAKYSLQFWKNYKWDNDKKPPFLAIVKADALGLVKGVVLGTVFWIGSNFIFGVPDAIGIVGGSTIAIGFTALDSFRFSKKFKNRTES